MFFHWSLSDSKCPQVSRTLLGILAVLNNVVVWMFFTHPQTYKSSSLFNNLLVTVPKAPIMISIIVTFISCLNFWDEAGWFLSLRVFGRLSSSFPSVLADMSSFFRCLSNSGTFTELQTTSPVLILLAITR